MEAPKRSPNPSVRRFIQRFTIWLCLVLPSIFIVEKFSGFVGVGFYCALAAFGVWAVSSGKVAIEERKAVYLAATTFVILGLLFALAYPIVNTHLPHRGSDDDDALNIGVSELLHGRYPYYTQTYLGNLIHHFPGSFLLAAPFVLLGTSALQNLAWLAVFFLLIRRELGSTSGALSWFWLTLLCSPIVLHGLVTGTDHVTNGIYIASGLWWLVTAKHKALPAAAWGVALSSRGNFLFLIPVAMGWLTQRHGWRASTKWLISTCITFALLTLPFYFFDPAGFAPLEATDRLTRFDDMIPHATWLIGGGMSSASLLLAWRGMKSTSDLWRSCAIVQAVPVIAGYLLGHDPVFLTYGGFFLCFGILAAVTGRSEIREKELSAA